MASSFQTVPEMLLHRLAATPDNTAFSYPVGSGWKQVSWKQFGEQVRHVSMGLRAIGLQNEERVAILCNTRYEWIVADIAILGAAGATTTIYPSNLADECEYIINDSNTRYVFAENDDQVAKLTSVRAKLTNVKNVITIDGKSSGDGWVLSLSDLMDKGKQATQAEWETVCKSVKGQDIATLIYTSGTTGKPKGVILTQDCWVYEAEGIDEMKLLVPDDVQFFWLPLAHSFGKVLEVAQLKIGFHTAIDGRVDKIVENLGHVKPTFVAAVPRIFEKVYNKVIDGAKKGGGAKYAIFKWAVGIGAEVSRLRQKRQEPSGLLAMKYSVATKLVFSKLQQRFGGRLRYFVSGSAALSRDMAEFFHGAGILILEGYGLTETSAASFVNRPTNFKFGTVGPPLPGTQVKIAEDGEILIKGRGVMRGYHNLPEQTAETIKDGWLYTGDIGELDSEGLLKITDRKKDLIKTSGGKYVAPQNIEGKFKMICPYVSQSLVHGNNRNFCTMLVALDKDAIGDWAKSNGVGGTYDQVVKDPRTHALIKPFVQELNKGLASYESIKNFAILPKDMTLEDGDLTPSLKLKRKVVETKYKELIDGFYTGNLAEL
ncbi:MAG: long-chain fatty acid--CoA ligase [Archangium sp.]|nr:long-chain fatty acid--CoA ligase [Archangium sp.]MDP3157494.1 long-chain fatty acid--CoA ligase [Archangium sp.]MDP3572781.1 long-chain fatty acid--CoA ligase [Archangium sp.]